VTKLEQEEQQEIAERIQNIENEPKGTNTPKAIVQEVLKRPHVSFNSGNNEWYTPAEFIEAAVKVMGKIDLDPASSEIANKTVKAEKYYTSETNGLAHNWFGNVWLNPPYSSDLIGKFADKVISEYGNYSQMIILVNNATETEWFCKLVSKASAVVFPKSRVKFYMPDGRTGAPLQGQAVLYIGSSPEKFLDCFKKFGWGAFLNGI
jgi:ParB family chromosome partitioning protein